VSGALPTPRKGQGSAPLRVLWAWVGGGAPLRHGVELALDGREGGGTLSRFAPRLRNEE